MALIRNLILTASLCGLLNAQDREVTVRLLAFNSADSNDKLLAYDSNNSSAGVPTPLKSYLNHEEVKIKTGGGSLIFSTSKTRPTKPEEILATAKLPATGSHFMLVFFPTEKKGSLKVMPLDDGLKAFPLGSYRIFNLSPNRVKLTLEKKDYDFPPGKELVIEDPPVNERMLSGMYAHALMGTQWQRIGASLWPHPGKKREIQFFYFNPLTKQIELQSIRDIAPPGSAPVAPPQ